MIRALYLISTRRADVMGQFANGRLTTIAAMVATPHAPDWPAPHNPIMGSGLHGVVEGRHVSAGSRDMILARGNAPEWDGHWYLRAFDDDGRPSGTRS
jgi:hypothetical protein